MDKKEFDFLVKRLHESGLNDDQIMHVFYDTFREGKCDLEDYEIMVAWLGYSLSDEFYEMHGLTRKHKRKTK